MVGSTAKKTRFKSKARTDERNNKKVGSNNTMRRYLNGVTSATTANAEHMQKMTVTTRSDCKITSWQK